LISQQEIAAWRPHAPWSDDLMVEQDYLLTKAVAAIFTNAKLKNQLAMRGGTVLHKAHLAPASRYSEDIDLVLTANRSHEGIGGRWRSRNQPTSTDVNNAAPISPVIPGCDGPGARTTPRVRPWARCSRRERARCSASP
jgi:hypothetical protein